MPPQRHQRLVLADHGQVAHATSCKQRQNALKLFVEPNFWRCQITSLLFDIPGFCLVANQSQQQNHPQSTWPCCSNHSNRALHLISATDKRCDSSSRNFNASGLPSSRSEDKARFLTYMTLTAWGVVLFSFLGFSSSRNVFKFHL